MSGPSEPLPPAHRTGTAAAAPTALCLCGGGITGAMYEIGVLAALDDWLVGSDFDVTRFDVVVGTSGGAVVACCIAGGLSPRKLYQAILDPDDTYIRMSRTDVYRVDVRNLLNVFRRVSGLLLANAGRTAFQRRFSLMDLFAGLEDRLPAGFFTLDHLEHFLDSFLERNGLPRTFAGMPRQLLIPANDLDTGHRAVFGEGALRDVPVPRAVVASSALPIFFEPVRIGGRDYIDGAMGKVDHADLAIARGCRLILVVNPRVPVNHDQSQTLPGVRGPLRRLREKGLLTISEQANRMSTKTKLHQGLRRYAAQHPQTDIVLIEPREDEAAIMLQQPMSFESRRQIVRFGYETAARTLEARRVELERAFAKQGIAIARRPSPGPMAAPQELVG